MCVCVCVSVSVCVRERDKDKDSRELLKNEYAPLCRHIVTLYYIGGLIVCVCVREIATHDYICMCVCV